MAYMEDIRAMIRRQGEAFQRRKATDLIIRRKCCISGCNNRGLKIVVFPTDNGAAVFKEIMCEEHIKEIRRLWKKAGLVWL